MDEVYLALYKDKGDFIDKIIRFFTRGKYSHCEIAVKKMEFITGSHYEHEIYFECYSSSPRDKGVRCKKINVNDCKKWDLIKLKNLTENEVKSYFKKTAGAKYDFFGVIGIILGIKENRHQYFCSEWCFNVIFNSKEGWRFSPNQLAVILKNKNKE